MKKYLYFSLGWLFSAGIFFAIPAYCFIKKVFPTWFMLPLIFGGISMIASIVTYFFYRFTRGEVSEELEDDEEGRW
jgi:biopolymer transport protein ExbB/TolQ